MKHLKILGLLVVAAASLMAFASSASAIPILTRVAGGTDYTEEIHATLEPGTSVLLKAGIEDTCTESTVLGTITLNNSIHAVGPISTLSFGKCTLDTTVKTNGSLTINDKGEVFAIGNRVEIKDTVFGITCFYGGAASPGTNIGTLTPGTTATMDISTTSLPRLEGSDPFFCAEKGTWTGKYLVTTPDTLLIT